MLHSKSMRLPCGCIVRLNENLTTNTWLVLDVVWCRLHRMVDIMIPEPKGWDSRDHPTKTAQRR